MDDNLMFIFFGIISIAWFFAGIAIWRDASSREKMIMKNFGEDAWQDWQ